MTQNKNECFFIMPIGNPEMDKLYEDIYKPLLEELNYQVIRIDKEEDGTLMTAQIIDYLDRCELIIADLTFERPNCYLEVGYIMGKNKYRNLILCCREDHNLDSGNRKKDGPKVHFDLQNFHIIWWEKDKFEFFKELLKEKILRRTSKTTPAKTTTRVKKVMPIDEAMKNERDGISI